MRTVYETNHFVSVRTARRYYRHYYPDPITTASAVARKFREGEIKIGEPPLKEGESVILLDESCRYGIAIDWSNLLCSP